MQSTAPKRNTEIWKTVQGYPYQQVSNLGRVRSLDRIVYQKNDSYRLIKGRMRKLVLHTNGYLTVALDGDKFYVHRLVAQEFIGPAPEGYDVCHENGDRKDNRAENLRYDTRLGNMADQRRHGTHGNTVKTHCPRGHILEMPNLVNLATRGGRRYCLSCRRASSRFKTMKRKPSVAEMQQMSDSYYEQFRGLLEGSDLPALF